MNFPENESMESSTSSDAKNIDDSKFLYRDESYAIRGAVFEVYREMGSGSLEAVYQECLCKELTRQSIPFREQARLQLEYKGEPLEQQYAPDFICYGKIILEIKGVKALAHVHRAQMINYLKATGLELGFLINFGAHPKVEIERMARSR